MEKGKAIFVTILMVAMLAAIDSCLYALNSYSFTILTGLFVVYGALRWALDFYRWLCKPGEEPTQRKKDPAGIENAERVNQENGKTIKNQNRTNRPERGAIVNAANSVEANA